MAIGNTGGEAADRGEGGVNLPQGIDGQEAETKIGKGSIVLKGNMSDGRLENRTTEGGESEHNGGTEGAERFSARATGRQTKKGASGGGKYRVITGSRQVQGGLV